jgi:hypothetical protein
MAVENIREIERRELRKFQYYLKNFMSLFYVTYTQQANFTDILVAREREREKKVLKYVNLFCSKRKFKGKNQLWVRKRKIKCLLNLLCSLQFQNSM